LLEQAFYTGEVHIARAEELLQNPSFAHFVDEVIGGADFMTMFLLVVPWYLCLVFELLRHINL